ncbi:acyl-CoA thioesterase [Halobaculum sp. MBLA0147]|uniref:acyl-CoA thioesterase n=1 Tax=Halobaculum sp. MBLA0147 TaxID=3079934 RepID=UPI0035254EC5
MPLETTVAVRYRDLDPMGHVNNAVYATLFEEARNAFFREVVGTELAETDAVLASLSVEFHAPVDGTDPVPVAVWVPTLGETSCTFGYEVRTADGDRAATGETVLVTLDDDGEPVPLPDALREAAAAYDDPPTPTER